MIGNAGCCNSKDKQLPWSLSSSQHCQILSVWTVLIEGPPSAENTYCAFKNQPSCSKVQQFLQRTYDVMMFSFEIKTVMYNSKSWLKTVQEQICVQTMGYQCNPSEMFPPKLLIIRLYAHLTCSGGQNFSIFPWCDILIHFHSSKSGECLRFCKSLPVFGILKNVILRLVSET